MIDSVQSSFQERWSVHLGNCDPAAAFTTAGEHGADAPLGGSAENVNVQE